MPLRKPIPDRHLTLHEAFEAQVEKTPEAIAVIFDQEQLTYGELNQRANQIAHYLRSLNVAPEVLVGVCLERSIEMVVGMLGILKAGAAFVPIDPLQPQERLAFILADTKIEILVTLKKLVAGISEPLRHLVCLDAEEKSLTAKSRSNPVSGVQPENLAYTIYTSGSTGQPKGVMVNHQAICQGFWWMQEISPITPQDRILQKLPLTFDFSFWELFWPLMTGACVILAKPGGEKDLNYLIKLIARQEISVLVFVPSVLQVILSENGLENCSNIRMVFTGGEPLTPALKERFFKLLPSCQLYDLFGGTENIIITYWCCQSNEPVSRFPRGHLFPDLSIYVVDEQLRPVPSGEQGELLVGGWGLARGYLNRPELMAQKFIPNPFHPNLGEQLYRTGDLVRKLSDGTLEILGRLDNQVKIRGFRVELGEIESALSQHPSVHEAVVVVREDKLDDKRLVAYLTANFTSSYIPVMQVYLKDKLPDYMMPNSIVLLDVMPLTPNGKVDRRALPAPDWHRKLDLTFIAPRTSTEEIVAKIWSEVLSIAQIGIDDNFLELAGHSLLAIQVISRVRQVFQVELPLGELFNASTVAKLSKRIKEGNREKLCLQAPRIQPVTRNQDLPLSWNQEQLWFFAQLKPDSSAYNEPCTICFTGAINVDALSKALNQIIKRHESLRTRFITVDGKPVQVVVPPDTFNLAVVDLGQLPQELRETEALRLATIDAKQPFDLTSEPLLRATLMQLASEDYRLFLTLHHIVMDDVSIRSIFLKELAALYEAFSTNKPSLLPELPVQYADFAVWQRKWLTEEILESQLDYWKQQLTDLPILQLPHDRPRPALQTFRGARQCLTLSKDRIEALKALSQQSGVTLYMTLLAAFKTLLYRYSGQEDVVVGTVSGGRNRLEIEGLIGYFLNILVLRTDLSGNPSFRDLLKRVREVTLGAYAHEDLPYQKLVERLQPERNLSKNPLFQVAFALEAPIPSLDVDWTRSYLDIQTDTTKFDLSMELDERPEGIVGQIEYSTDLFDAATIVRMIGHFQTLLKSIVANPNQRITELPLLTKVERYQLLVEWNTTKTEYPQDKCIHQLFEEQVELTPDAVAIVFEDQQLTYRELNTKANQLAHYLKTLGVKPEVLVGICVERSLGMIVGILGILKAGGAYVPLDPIYPQERLAFMLKDANVSVLLTQSRLVERLTLNLAQVVYLDKEWQDIAQQSAENLAGKVESGNLAYVIYTSGSTGTPKGVLIEHRSLVNYTCAANAEYGITRYDRILQFTSLNFDVSAEEIYTCLTTGATLVLRTDVMLESNQAFLQKCQEWSITVAILPTAYWHALAARLKADELAIPLTLRLVVIGGEKAIPARLQNWRKSVGTATRLINAYGPTEATISALLCNLSDSNPQHSLQEVSIGRPIANTQVYILDRYLQPVPIGVAGELHLGGEGLARGYLNRLDLTQEKFIPNPFSKKPNSRLYKTGDLARYLPDGNIEFLGRLDHQVKLRGFRIEPGEIEAVLNQHSSIRETAVIARETITGDKQLVAYIVPYQEPAPTVVDLRRFMKEQLPDYMVPSTFVMLSGLPLTPNGKVDRCALPTPELRSSLALTFVAPQTEIEETLAVIWSKVLGLQQVGIHENFFELGGHSLLAVQLISRIREAFAIELPLCRLFDSPTIAALSKEIDSFQNDPS